MRKYEPIWLEVKVNHIAKLRAPKDSFSRIITGVRKEKARDYAWKLEMNEKYPGKVFKMREIIDYDSEILTFFLELEESLSKLSADQL